MLKSLGKKWRNYKHDLKKRYFDRSDGIKTTLRKIPPHVVKWQYKRLVAFWYSGKGEVVYNISTNYFVSKHIGKHILIFYTNDHM